MMRSSILENQQKRQSSVQEKKRSSSGEMQKRDHSAPREYTANKKIPTNNNYNYTFSTNGLFQNISESYDYQQSGVWIGSSILRQSIYPNTHNNGDIQQYTHSSGKKKRNGQSQDHKQLDQQLNDQNISQSNASNHIGLLSNRLNYSNNGPKNNESWRDMQKLLNEYKAVQNKISLNGKSKDQDDNLSSIKPLDTVPIGYLPRILGGQQLDNSNNVKYIQGQNIQQAKARRNSRQKMLKSIKSTLTKHPALAAQISIYAQSPSNSPTDIIAQLLGGKKKSNNNNQLNNQSSFRYPNRNKSGIECNNSQILNQNTNNNNKQFEQTIDRLCESAVGVNNQAYFSSLNSGYNMINQRNSNNTSSNGTRNSLSKNNNNNNNTNVKNYIDLNKKMVVSKLQQNISEGVSNNNTSRKNNGNTKNQVNIVIGTEQGNQGIVVSSFITDQFEQQERNELDGDQIESKEDINDQGMIGIKKQKEITENQEEGVQIILAVGCGGKDKKGKIVQDDQQKKIQYSQGKEEEDKQVIIGEQQINQEGQEQQLKESQNLISQQSAIEQQQQMLVNGNNIYISSNQSHQRSKSLQIKNDYDKNQIKKKDNGSNKIQENKQNVQQYQKGTTGVNNTLGIQRRITLPLSEGSQELARFGITKENNMKVQVNGKNNTFYNNKKEGYSNNNINRGQTNSASKTDRNNNNNNSNVYQGGINISDGQQYYYSIENTNLNQSLLRLPKTNYYQQLGFSTIDTYNQQKDLKDAAINANRMKNYQQRLLLKQQFAMNDQSFSCFFASGNNSGLVRRVLMTRSNWRESPSYNCNINFRWHPFSKGIKFENLSAHKKRIVNHFEFHSELTTKNGLIKNLSRYCSERGLNVFDYTPCTFLLSLKSKYWDADLQRFCQFFNLNLPESMQGKQEYSKKTFDIRKKFKIINIPGCQGNKKKKNIGIEKVSSSIIGSPGSQQYHGEVVQGDYKIHKSFLGEQSSSYMWLLKPTNLNRGRGIELFSDLQELEDLLNNYFEGFYEQPIKDNTGIVEKKENEEKDRKDMDKEEIKRSKSCRNESGCGENDCQCDGQMEGNGQDGCEIDQMEVKVVDEGEQGQGEEEEVKGGQQEKIKSDQQCQQGLSGKKDEKVNLDLDLTAEQQLMKTEESVQISKEEMDKLALQISLKSQPARGDVDTQEIQQISARKEKKSNKQDNNSKVNKKTKNPSINSNNGIISTNNNSKLTNEKDKVNKRDLSAFRNRSSTNPTASCNSTGNNKSTVPHSSSGNRVKANSVYQQQQQQQQPQVSQQQPNGNINSGISAEFGGTLMKEHSFVIQKYIERPLLLGGRKFDIRMWVLVTGSLDVYLFKEGYIRTSSKPFDLSDTNDIFVHLTNNAIQKYSENYGQFESGNQLSLKQFDEYMKASGQINRSFRKDIMPSIEEIVMMSMLSVGKQLNANDRKVSFELFGYDFFVDSDFKVWLIEVNTNPCIEESSPLLGMLIPRMIDDALKLTVDVLFPPQYAEGDDKLNISNVNNTPQKNSKQYDNNSNELSQDCNNSNKSSNLSGKNTGVLNGNVSNTDQKGNAIRPSLFPVDGYSSESMFNFLLNLNKHQ